MKYLRWTVLLVLACLSAASAQERETIYGEDLCWRLATPADIRRVTSIRARLRREAKEAEPFFELTPPPFDDIPAAPNQHDYIVKKTSWSLPPWPSVGPALPADVPESIRKMMEEQDQPADRADVFGEILPEGEERRYSRRLVPKAVPLDQQTIFRHKTLVEPFSLRRYYDKADVFIQLAAYGGTSSIRAEEAYRAMKEAATRQQKMEGFGAEAFLTRVVITEDLPDEPEEEIDPNIPPFADLAPLEAARPELADSAKAVALMAPAFQTIEVKDLVGKRVRYPQAHKRYKASTGRVLNSLLVLVAFYPEKSVTLSFAVEERMGSAQDLIALALMVQRRLKEEIEPNA